VTYQRFVGKVGIVTGAGMSIGAAVARALARKVPHRARSQPK
jgi:NAD(P)-dependent dehydrogenase (short-subunit alcohol dehydrogenase family)